MSQDQSHISDAIEDLLNSLQSVQLATLNAEQHPEISYTPVLRFEGRYYIFISELASHTQNILLQPKLSLLFIEDERSAKNIFARKRLSLNVLASECEQGNEQWELILDEFEKRQGKTVSLLKQLPDFHLFKLTPESGTFVQGFGQAFELSGENLHIIKAKTV